MSVGMTIAVRDEVSRLCPACPSPEIELVYVTGGGSNGRYEWQRYAMRCKHQAVCKLRHDFINKTAKEVDAWALSTSATRS